MKRTPSKKVIVEIKGGVGNQMFQYAAAKALSLDLGGDLVLEKRLGFVLDHQYRGTFQLDRFPVSYISSSWLDSTPFLIDRLKSLYARRISKRDVKENSRNYLFERDFHFVDLSKARTTKKRYRLAGYYQDPRYFGSHLETILKELTPPTPIEVKYLDLADLGQKYNLIALGIRMYEESPTPEAHARDKVVKTISEYQLALAELLRQVSNPLILVFTSKEFDFLKTMDLPVESIFVNPDRGFTDTIDTLWLMSRCRHHIFNNSTFYWWGAVLSQVNYDPSDQRVLYADNFLNPKIGYPRWESF